MIRFYANKFRLTLPYRNLKFTIKMKKTILFSIFFFSIMNFSKSQELIKLYPNGVKESNEIKLPESYRDSSFIKDISEPRMKAYIASKENSNGTAVLICPGGGYAGVSFIKEGSEFATWFNKLGISAFVLYYRMPNGHWKIPLGDAQRAMEIVNERADEWNIDKRKIGIMGFSAGGHLASTVGTHFKTPEQKPAFMILAYPVITMDSSFTHQGSRKNLLGLNPSNDLVQLYSNELMVTKNSPPTFILHANDDKTVPIKNSLKFYEALKKMHIEVELDTFAIGGHGFGMRKRGIQVDNWPELLEKWLKTNKLTK